MREKKCARKVTAMATVKVTDDTFNSEVRESDIPVLVDFWAEWCGPCRMVGPIIEDLSNEYEGRVLVGKVDVDSNPEVSMKYGIRSIPTILILKNGEVVEKHVGTTTKANLAEKIDKHL